MRTITELHRNRLEAEAQEAEIEELTVVAKNITRQIEKTGIRNNNAGYTYSNEDFQQDVQDNLWNIIVRTADFHGTHVDSLKAQELVDFYSEELISVIRQAARVYDNIGAHEPSVPGELDINEE